MIRKLLFIIGLFTCTMQAQFIAENIILSTTPGLEYEASIETDESGVTLTLVGPSDRWLAFGFGVTSMTNGGDVVIFDGTNLSDRTFVGFVQPQIDAVQNWTIESNTVQGNVRTLVATRALDAGSSNFLFQNDGQNFPVVWARGNGSTFSISNHGGANRGSAVAEFETLSNQDFSIVASWEFFPNPTRGGITMNIPPTLLGEAIEIYNLLGRRVVTQRISTIQEQMQLDNLSKGNYLVRITNHPNTQKLILK
jgi:hypothetical protein